MTSWKITEGTRYEYGSSLRPSWTPLRRAASLSGSSRGNAAGRALVRRVRLGLAPLKRDSAEGLKRKSLERLRGWLGKRNWNDPLLDGLCLMERWAQCHPPDATGSRQRC